MTKADKNWQRVARIVADTIHTKRNELGWSVKKLAKEADLSASIIYATEAGDKLPRVENIEAMLRALGVVVVLGGFREPQDKPRVRGFERVSTAPKDTQLPTRKTKGSACYDMYLPCDVTIEAGGFTEPIYLGVKAYMQPDEVLHMFIRSSVGLVKKVMLCNCVSVIDVDYYNCEDNEGNIGIVLHNFGKETVSFKKGERICQAKFSKFLIADGDSVTQERKGGIGSTNGIFEKE